MNVETDKKCKNENENKKKDYMTIKYILLHASTEMKIEQHVSG